MLLKNGISKREGESMSSERDSPMSLQTKPSFYQPIGFQIMCERESPMCFQTKPSFLSEWESRLYLVWFGNTLGLVWFGNT